MKIRCAACGALVSIDLTGQLDQVDPDDLDELLDLIEARLDEDDDD